MILLIELSASLGSPTISPGDTIFPNGSIITDRCGIPCFGWVILEGCFYADCGDANCSGGITPADGYYILNYLGGGSFPPSSCWAANANGENGITSADGYWLLNYIGVGPMPNCAPCSFLSSGPKREGTVQE
jgi:hypothetical protein